MTRGIRTVRIATRLRRNLRDFLKAHPDARICHDHGDSRDPDVLRPTSYMGRQYGADATLSGLDIVLVRNGRASIIIEVEESYVRPKIVLGDIFGVVLADRIRIEGEPIPVRNSLLIVALVVTDKGERARKYDRLQRHVAKFVSAINEARSPTRVNKVRIVTAPEADLVRRIERLTRLELSKELKET
ncbi:MAG: hypothetical protein O7H41_00530 [Planctomycetota bacterium]|nr:hypothetical protein [Planctomycetota bacterium]